LSDVVRIATSIKRESNVEPTAEELRETQKQVAILTDTVNTLLQPQLVVLPHDLDFGEVDPGVSATETVSLFNPSRTLPIQITIGVKQITGPFVATAPDTPQVLAPLGSLAIPIAFTPPDAGQFPGGLDVDWNTGVSNGTTKIDLDGRGSTAQPQLVAPVSTLNFVFNESTPPQDQTVTLFNLSGKSPVRIIKIEPSPDTNFKATAKGPLELPSSGSLPISVTFTPSDNTDAPVIGSLSITWTGAGTGAASQTVQIRLVGISA
jgi:hypothetical protein